MKAFHCPYCGVEFELDDWAYLNETGLCQSCHELITETVSEFNKIWRLHNESSPKRSVCGQGSSEEDF